MVTFLAVVGMLFFRSRDLGRAMNILGSTLSWQLSASGANLLFLPRRAVFIAHRAQDHCRPHLARLKAMTPAASGSGLLTGQFMTVVSPIPLIFVLFLSILHNSSAKLHSLCAILSSLSLKASQ